jgi:hypothetical protein
MSLTDLTFKSYPKIPSFGYDGTEDILDGYVVVQPKIDGSNVAVWLWNGEYRLARRNGWIDEENDNSFRAFIDWFQNEWENNERLRILADELEQPRAYFGEFSNNQNKLKYSEKVPFILFDVGDFTPVDDESGGFFTFGDHYDVEAWADTLGWRYVGLLYYGPGENLKIEELTEKFLGKESVLGGPDEEGVVVKRYGAKTRFGRNYFAKIVSAEFREKQRVKIRAVRSGSGIGEWARESFLNEARVRKGIQKLKEDGTWDSVNARKNTGKLIGVVVKDIHDEHIDEINAKALDYIWKECSKAISKDVVVELDEIMVKDADD